MSDKFKGAIILSIGTGVPPYKIGQDAHYEILESANGLDRYQKLLLKKVYSNSGIAYRYSVINEFDKTDFSNNKVFNPDSGEGINISARMELFDEHAVSLGAEAISNCLKKPGVNPEEVTHLITFSCTGMSAPGIDIQLIERLGLKRNVERTCINFMGCYAAFNALKMANYIVAADPGAVVLLCGVELCTLHYQKSLVYDQMIANALFGDGAAAVLVGSKEKFPDKEGLAIGKFYSEFEPGGINEMTWKIGDSGFDIRLSNYVPALIEGSIGKLLNKLFESSGLKKEDIDWYAIHPGGIKILEACEKAMGIGKFENEYAYEILSNFGNMSSVTILFVLEKYFRKIEANHGNKILACAFGPGLTVESMILTAFKGG